jgi:hypothetical protein
MQKFLPNDALIAYEHWPPGTSVRIVVPKQTEGPGFSNVPGKTHLRSAYVMIEPLLTIMPSRSCMLGCWWTFHKVLPEVVNNLRHQFGASTWPAPIGTFRWAHCNLVCSAGQSSLNATLSF